MIPLNLIKPGVVINHDGKDKRILNVDTIQMKILKLIIQDVESGDTEQIFADIVPIGNAVPGSEPWMN